MATTKLMTAEELEQMPGDEYRYDLIRGCCAACRRPASVTFRCRHVRRRVAQPVTPRGLRVVGGEEGFVLERDPDTVLAPDVVFVRADRLPAEEERNRVARLVPDLAVDPRKRTARLGKPDGTDRLLTEADELTGEEVVSDFRLPAARLFASPA